MSLKTLNSPKVRPLAHIAAVARDAVKPAKKEMTRGMDDYSVCDTSDGTAWCVCGIRLGTTTLEFPSRQEANARGNELARAARVSLWYEPTSHRRDAVLVVSFRDEKLQ